MLNGKERTNLQARSESLSRLPSSIPESIRKLRSSNIPLYVEKLICFLRTRARSCHPFTNIGWWCRYEEQMRDLVTFLSEPDVSLQQLWKSFREEMARQLSFCRQCTSAYHKAVREWELSNEVSLWSKEVIRKRVSNLVEWDILRLTPALEKGSKRTLSADDPNVTTSRTQCREAFLDGTLSLRLCMDTAFCAVLDKVFRAQFAVPTHEDFKRFIIEYGAIPPGLAALCFHSYDKVRLWAKTLYVTSPPHLQVEDQALQLLISKSLRLAVDKSGNVDDMNRSRRTVWAPDLQSIWDGVNILVRRMPSDSLRIMMKRSKKFPIVDAVYNFLMLHVKGRPICGVPPGFSHVLSSLQCVLMETPLPSLLECCDLTPEKFLDVVFECVKIHRLGQNERLLLLDMIMDISSSSIKWNNTFDTHGLFLQWFGLLEHLRIPERHDAHGSLENKTTRNNRENDSFADVLAKGARLVVKFYWHFWPQLLLDDRKRLTEFITTVVRALPDSFWAWELLRSALLTDVCGLLLCIYEPHEVQNIFGMCFSSFTEMREAQNKKTSPLQEGIMKMLTTAKSTSQEYLPWMDELWGNVRTGAHISEESRHSKKVCNFDVRLALDLHRLVGVLDPQRCNGLIKGVTKDSNVAEMSANVSDRLISLRVEMVFETILSRLQLTGQNSAANISSQDLSRQAGHLLTSSHGKISKEIHLALLKKCKIQNAILARPQSRDRVLVHILKHNEKDRLMVYEGFTSVSRLISAQSRAVSARTYISFFRWYSLLASRDCRVLWDTNTLKGAFRILLNFLETLEVFEAAMTSEGFLESVRRVFSMIPSVWDSFNDYEKSIYEGSAEKSTLFTGNVRPLVRKVGVKLLTSCTMRDKLALDAWVRMVTQDTIRSALNRMDASREILMRVLRKNVGERGPLDFEQCHRLANAYSLDEASALLDSWSAREAGRPPRQSFKTMTVNPYREDRIAGCSSAIIDRNVRFRRSSRKKLPLLSAPVPSTRHNGYLHDLRRDHRQARAELRRAAAVYGPVWESCEPLKTRFELIREERIAQRQRESFDVNHDMIIVHGLKTHPGVYDRQCRSADSHNDSRQPSSHARNPSEETEVRSARYPNSRRKIRTRSLEQVKRALLISEDPHCLGADLYKGVAPQTFQDVESYVSYWEPLLIAEFRAAIRRRTEEERSLMAQDRRSSRKLSAGRIFEVDGPAEDVGYLHTLSVSCHNPHMDSRLGESGVREKRPFDESREQASDVLLLEISEPGQTPLKTRNGRREMITAIVSNVVRTRKKTQLSLFLVFGEVPAPGKGRKIEVRKLLSFATLHRQLDALWTLPKAPDGVLWSLMDPVNAWRTKRDLEARKEHRVDLNSSLPMRLVEKVERVGLLNASQCKAVADVIRSCHCLFAPPDRDRESRFKNENNSSVSLIQGPPGTGKTSTIIALLSALLSGIDSQTYSRKAIVVEGISLVVTIPAIRVLVCAPSNAAVDEIMGRVVDEGLINLSEHQVCPRIVRVGQGTTVRALQALEVHSIAKSARKESLLFETAPTQSLSEYHQKLLEVNEQIGKLEDVRRSISVQTDAESDRKGFESGVSPSALESLEPINEKLRILQNKKNMLHSVLKKKQETRKTEDKSRRQEDMRAVLETLATASVVFATLSSAGHEDVKSLGVGFDVVIIDEAGQSCEPETLIPLTIGQHRGSTEHRFMHTVLVGDPKQLPPTILSANHLVTTALGRSLFERIAHVDPSAVHLLDTQYRMHPNISSFPSSRFYDGLLRNSCTVKDKTMHRIWHFDPEKRFGPLTFFDTANTFAKEARNHSGSLSNHIEAMFVIQGILSMLRLYRREDLVQSIVVLSPYKQQVKLLKKLIAQNEELKVANVEASTIDGIQGREKSVVVLSTVRSGHSRDIGFVKDDRRLNVALTRAKHSLLIFGHASFLSKHSESWAALVAHCHERSQVRSLSSAYNVIFRESHGLSRSWIPQALPEVEKLPDIKDESSANTSPTLNVTSKTKSFRHEKGHESVDTLEENKVNCTDVLAKACTPNPQDAKESRGFIAKMHRQKDRSKGTHDVLQPRGVYDNLALFSVAREYNDESRPPIVKSEDVLTNVQSCRKKVGPAEKRSKSSETPNVTTRADKRRLVETTRTNFSTRNRFEQSNVLLLERGRRLSRDASPSLCRRLQDESSQMGGQIHASLRLPGMVMGTGRRNVDREQPKALVPAKRAYSSDHEPLYNTATVLKKARPGSSAKLESYHRRPYTRSLNEQRTAATLQAKPRIFLKSAHFQNQAQAKQRLRHINHGQRDRRDCFPNSDAKHSAQVQAQRKNSMSTFSLADTRAKLKVTLEAARKAKH